MAPESIGLEGALLEEVVKVQKSGPSASDLASAMPSECAVQHTDEMGNERIDYEGVPLKNADGTPNKYAKRLAELHMPRARKGAELSQKLAANGPREEVLVDRSGRKLKLPARLAESVARARGLKPVPMKAKRTYRAVFQEDGPTLYRNPDGDLVRLERTGSGIVEVPA